MKGEDSFSETKEIKPYEKNAKVHTDAQLIQLARIVKEVGWRQPVVVNQSGVIIVGHGRYIASKKYGVEYGLDPLWVMDDAGRTVCGGASSVPMTEEQERTYRLADNKLNESGWDMGKAVMELRLLSADMLEMTGFNVDELEAHESADEIAKLSREREIDSGKYSVATVEAPETPRLKARASFYFDSIGEFEEAKKFFGVQGGVLDHKKLVALMRKKA